MANRWGTMETERDFILGGSKITTDGDCSHKIKRCLLLGRKVMTNLDSILKSRDITLPTKVHLVKAMLFPVVMYECESWTIKKAECWRIDAFEMWCWRRRLRVPWTARRSNQSILKKVSPEYSLEGLMLKLKLKYFGHLRQRTLLKRPWWWERLKAEGKRDNRGWDGRMASLTEQTWVWVSSRSWWWTGKPSVLQSMRLQRVGHDWATELNWTECLPSFIFKKSSQDSLPPWSSLLALLDITAKLHDEFASTFLSFHASHLLSQFPQEWLLPSVIQRLLLSKLPMTSMCLSHSWALN